MNRNNISNTVICKNKAAQNGDNRAKRSFFFHLFNTSSFVLCSVQLILSILLHIHISKASIRLTSSFLIYHVSAPYSVTLHSSDLTILFLMSLLNDLNPPFNNSFFCKRFFSITILFLISLWPFASGFPSSRLR